MKDNNTHMVDMMKNLFIYLIFGLFLLEVGCGKSVSSPDFEPQLNSIPVPTHSTASTVTAQTTATEALFMVPVDTETQQSVSTHTTTFTPEPPTQIPTLPEATAKARITSLLKTNGNCRLPCWWGITPGLTEWVDASKILDPLSGRSKFLSTGWWYYFPNLENETYLNQHFILDGEVVDTIEVTFGYSLFLTLPEFLAEYGSPSEIYIRTFSNEHQGITPIYILLFYEKQGILARFESDNARLTAQKTVQICLQQEPIWGIVLWPPSHQQTYWEVVEIANMVGLGGSDDDHLPVLPIKDVTNFDPYTFYVTFKDSNNPTCLETPAELWPGQFQ